MRKIPLILLASLLLLSACGQKGPLFLPNDATVDPAVNPTNPAVENTSEDENTTKSAAESSD